MRLQARATESTFYQFESEWMITADIDRIFETLLDYRHFSSWWQAVSDVRLLTEGDSQHLGAKASYSMRSPLFYSLDFVVTIVDLERPRKIQIASDGDLAGSGIYLLSEDPAATRVTFMWNVATTRAWMNVVAPVARPFFVWAHHSVMRDGGAGLARYLGGSMISCRSGVKPNGSGDHPASPSRNGFGTLEG